MYKLTEHEVNMIIKIGRDYPDASDFRLEQNSDSGIGLTTYLYFTHDKLKLRVDITDIESW